MSVRRIDTGVTNSIPAAIRRRPCWYGYTAPRVVDENEMELTMHELRLMGGLGRAVVVVSTVFGVATLSAGAASADGPVQIRSRLGTFVWTPPVRAGTSRS